MVDSDNINEPREIEVLDSENYYGGGKQIFSHPLLVMGVLRRANELGSRELHAGWMDERVDRQGNKIMIYREDTRKAFIEAVKTVECNMDCDYDPHIKKHLNYLKQKLYNYKKECLKREEEEWQKLPQKIKAQRINEGYINRVDAFEIDSYWHQKFIESEVYYHREILKALNRLAKRLDWYTEEEWEA